MKAAFVKKERGEWVSGVVVLMVVVVRVALVVRVSSRGGRGGGGGGGGVKIKHLEQVEPKPRTLK